MSVGEGDSTKKIDRANVLKADPATKYDQAMAKQQKLEGWALSSVLLVAVALTFFFFRIPNRWWACVLLAALGGIIGGLLHSLKWFYRTIGRGEWEWDMLWWRFLNPLVSGVMGFSFFIAFRSGIQKGGLPETGDSKEAFVAYSVGFLTGLFADNAMSKLRDIAYVIFGQTAPPPSKPKSEKKDQRELESSST